MGNWLEISGLFVAVATTLIATLLIVFRIHSLSRNNAALNTGRRYVQILNLLLQSSALHLVGLLLFAIPMAFPRTDVNILQVKNSLSYAGAFFPFAAVCLLRFYFEH